MQPYLGYFIILSICVLIGLAGFGKIKPKYFPYILYGSGLAMILLTTLAGPYLIGSDIHIEYYFANYYGQTGLAGPILLSGPQGTSIANNLIAPALPWPLLWTYKIFFPMIFASTPVFLYHIARKWLLTKQALLSSFLFIAFTPFFLEIPTIAREMLAETALVIVMWAMLRLNTRWKYLVIGVCAALIPLFHYSIAIVATVIFSTAVPISLLLRKHRLQVTLTLLTMVVVSAGYFPFIQEGTVVRKIVHYYNNYVPYELRIKNPNLEMLQPAENSIIVDTGRNNLGEDPDPSVLVGWLDIPFYDRYSTLVKTALGADILQTNTIGKAFRVSQWLVIILVIPGLWILRRNKSYWVLGAGFILISALCLAPGWASTLNMTRFAHITMMMVSIPIAAALRPKYLTPILLIYFLLSSGFVFEITKQPNIQLLTAPYNIGLSDYRIDLGASITKDDLLVRDYIVENELFPTNSDIHGAALLDERIGLLGPRIDKHLQLPKTPRPINGYVFIRSRNATDGIFVLWSDIGLRTYSPMEEWLSPYEYVTIFQSGDAKVIKLED